MLEFDKGTLFPDPFWLPQLLPCSSLHNEKDFRLYLQYRDNVIFPAEAWDFTDGYWLIHRSRLPHVGGPLTVLIEEAVRDSPGRVVYLSEEDMPSSFGILRKFLYFDSIHLVRAMHIQEKILRLLLHPSSVLHNKYHLRCRCCANSVMCQNDY